METYILDPQLQKAGQMLLEDLKALEMFINDIEIICESSPRLKAFYEEILNAVEKEIRYRRELILEIAEAYIH